MDEGETYFWEVFYSGFYMTKGFVRPIGQNKHKHKVTTHTQETHKTSANTINNT
jgi:hypothetical protein